ILANLDTVKIDSGATLDFNGFAGAVAGLSGAGTLEGHGNTTIEIAGGNFAGAINGAIALEVTGGVTLYGGGNFTGGVTIDNHATLDIFNAAQEDVTFGSGGITDLVLHDANAYDGTISGLGTSGGGEIDLREIDFADGITLHYNHNGVLTVSDG